MTMKQCFFAVDLGATSGRTILGSFTSNGLEMEEVNRFPNHLIEVNGHFYWDICELYRNIIEGLKLATTGMPTALDVHWFNKSLRLPPPITCNVSIGLENKARKSSST